MGDIAQKCKSTRPRTSFLYLNPKDPKSQIRFVDCPVVLHKFALAMVAWEKGKPVYELIEEEMKKQTEKQSFDSYEDRYKFILSLGDNIVTQCCVQCKAKYDSITARTFEITDRKEYLEEIVQLKREIVQAGFHKKLDSIFPHCALLKNYDDRYQDEIQGIKDYAYEHFLGDTFVFAMEYWDDMEEDFVLFVYGKNEGRDEGVEFLMNLLTT